MFFLWFYVLIIIVFVLLVLLVPVEFRLFEKILILDTGAGT